MFHLAVVALGSPTWGLTPGSHCRAQEMNFGSALDSGCAVSCVGLCLGFLTGFLGPYLEMRFLDVWKRFLTNPELLSSTSAVLSLVRMLPFPPWNNNSFLLFPTEL